MATSREYADFILQKFSRLEGVVTIRPMMGEYVIHMAGKVLGFLGDEQLILEPGPTIAQLLPEAEKRELFPGSKLMYIVDDSISPHRLCEIAEAIYDDLPVSKPRKKDSRAKAAAASKSSASASKSSASASGASASATKSSASATKSSASATKSSASGASVSASGASASATKSSASGASASATKSSASGASVSASGATGFTTKSSASASRATASASGATGRTNTGARKKESEKTDDDIDKMFPFAKHIKW